MRKYSALVGEDKKRIKIKVALLSTLTDTDELWELCNYKELWGYETLNAIMMRISNSIGRENNKRLFYNVANSLLKFGGSDVNNYFASLLICHKSIALLPYLDVSKFKLKYVISERFALNRSEENTDLLIIDSYIKAGRIIPKFIFEILLSHKLKKSKYSYLFKYIVYNGVKCSEWMSIVCEYCLDILTNRTNYTNDELDTLYLSITYAFPSIKYDNDVFPITQYWAKGGSKFPVHTDVDMDQENFKLYITSLNDSNRLDNAFIYSLYRCVRKDVVEVVKDELYKHQLNNPSIYYNIPSMYRIRDIQVVYDYHEQGKLKPNPWVDVKLSFLENIKYSPLEFSDLELFFKLGGSYTNVDWGYITHVNYDLIFENSYNFENLEKYLWISRDGEAIDEALRKSKPSDFKSTTANMYGIGGSDFTLSKLNIMQFSNIFITKGTYLEVAIENPIILKYYQPRYLSVVDYIYMVNSNPKCIDYIDIIFYSITQLIDLIQEGVLKLNHPFFLKHREILIQILQSRVDITTVIENLIYLYRIDPIMADDYINRKIS